MHRRALISAAALAALGTGGTFGQAWVPGMPWPKINIPSYTRWIGR